MHQLSGHISLYSLEKCAPSNLKRCREIIEPKLREALCGFRSGRSTTDQIYTLQQNFEKLWEWPKDVSPYFFRL